VDYHINQFVTKIPHCWEIKHSNYIMFNNATRATLTKIPSMKYYEVSYYLSRSCGTPNRSRVSWWLLNDEWSNVEKKQNKKNYKSTFFEWNHQNRSNKHRCGETNARLVASRRERTRRSRGRQYTDCIGWNGFVYLGADPKSYVWDVTIKIIRAMTQTTLPRRLRWAGCHI